MIFCFDFRVIKKGDKTENEIILNFYLEKIFSELWILFFNAIEKEIIFNMEKKGSIMHFPRFLNRILIARLYWSNILWIGNL